MRKIKSLIYIAFALLFSSCALPKEKISGDGDIIEKGYTFEAIVYQLKIENFSMLTFPVTIKFIAGTEPKITIKADTNIMEEIRVETKKNAISISGQKHTVYDATELQINVSNLLISKISLQGNYKIVSDITNFTENFSLVANGTLSGNIDFASVSNQLKVEINGTADFLINNVAVLFFKLTSTGDIVLSLNGIANNAHINGAGRITLEAPFFKCEDIYLFLDGVVNVIVYPIKTLTITAEGVGKIKYRGNPEITRGTKGDFAISPY
ncbi:MAG: DUF2807 domain-containing protein [Bacilli bacterium]|nr:DUF2807 domain-containing protein [Bacilli bacterium]MDD4077157.1 DUF2807 domain-containing protein [Bacilli bacterium]